MSYVNISLGIITLLIIVGIVTTGNYSEAMSDPENIKFYTDHNYLPPNFDVLLDSLDSNITKNVVDGFEDTNLSPATKKVVYYVTKGVIAGLYTDLYLGMMINEHMPGIYYWITNNMYLVFAGIIILIFPDIVSLFIWCIFGLLLILKERFFDKPNKKPKNIWRDK